MIKIIERIKFILKYFGFGIQNLHKMALSENIFFQMVPMTRKQYSQGFVDILVLVSSLLRRTKKKLTAKVHSTMTYQDIQRH